MTDWLEEVLDQVQDQERPEGRLDWLTAIPSSEYGGVRHSGGGQDAWEPAQPWEGEDRPASRDRRRWTESSRAEMRDDAGEQAVPQADGPDAQNERLGTEEPLVLRSPGEAIEAARRRLEQAMETAEQRLGQGQTGEPAERTQRRTAGEQTLPRLSERAAVETDGAVQGKTEKRGADGLYQQLVRAGRTAEAVRPVRQTTVAEQMSAGAPSLTVDELDRAVRRDSRRYDAGMELY